MSEEFRVVLHEIAKDGLPDMEKPGLYVAFVFDGCLVSGWPLEDREEDGEIPWEANSDVGHERLFFGVTHWVELPKGVVYAGLHAASKEAA